ncbi:phospholipase-like protein [Tanacetum coccineum]
MLPVKLILDGLNDSQQVSFITEAEEGDSSETLLCQLPPKEMNPGSFTLPCTIGNLKLYVMADLGTSVNVMPKSLFKYLKLADLKETNMVVEMADMPKKALLGIVENILIDVFRREISLRIGEEKVKFDMNGRICHSRVPFEKIYITSSVQESEYFNPLEIETAVFSYDSPACLLFEQSTHPCSDVSIDIVDSSDHMQELKGSQEDEVGSHLLENVVSRWHVCKPICVTVKDCEKDYRKWPTCNLDLNFCSGYDAIYKESGMLKQWIFFEIMKDKMLGKTRDDPYSRRFDVYKEKLDSEIEQLANEYDLRLGMKKYALDDIWVKFERFQDTACQWHDEGFEEEEQWESGIENTCYTPPCVKSETFEIDVFRREISLRIGEEKVKFDMNGRICHSRVPFEKIYITSSVQESEYFNPLEIETDVFSYDSPVCLLFEQSTHPCSDVSIDTVDSSDNIQEFKGSQEDEVGSHLLENVVSRWHVCKPVHVTIKDCEKDCEKWPTCNPDLSFCSGYDDIYGKEESGMLKQWICFRDHERQNFRGNVMIFADFLKVSEAIKYEMFKEWVKEIFNFEVDFRKIRDDPYSRRFNVYKEKFDSEIE